MIKLKTPTTATFYILDQTILYSVPTEDSWPLDHSALWPRVTAKMFPSLDPYQRMELNKAPFGAERGRVTFHDKTYTLTGTPGIAAFRTRLQRLFGLLGFDQRYEEIFFEHPDFQIRMYDRNLIETHSSIMRKGRSNLRIA